MDKKRLNELANRIIVHRCVNLYADGNALDTGAIDDITKRIIETQRENYYIIVNIENIPGENEKKEAGYLKDIINEEMAKKQFPHWIHEANTIEHLLHQLNERLENPALIVFHHFTSPEDEKEKNLLRSIRKFIQMRDSILLGLLLISSQKLYKWDLRPGSDLDERFVDFFSYE